MVVVVMIFGNVLVKDVIWEYNCFLIFKLMEMGVEVLEEEDGICVKVDIKKLKLVIVKIFFYLGFFIDM